MTLISAADVRSTNAGLDPDLDLASLKLDWVSPSVTDLEARGAITGIALERSIEGASTVTITIEDPDGVIFADDRMWAPKSRKRTAVERDVTGARVRRPTMRGRAMQVVLDGIAFRLVQVSRNGTSLTLTFEDRVVYWLRRQSGERRVYASRKDVTRAQFILSLLREVKTERIRFVCPELNVRQSVDSGAKVTATQAPSTAKGGGLSSAKLVVKDPSGKTRPATAENRRIGSRVLAVANDTNAGPKATLALMEAVMIESQITNTPKGTSSSVGVLQLLDIHGPVSKRMDVEWCVRKFLTEGFTGRGGAIKLAKNAGLSAGQVAQACQGSAYPDRYDKVRNESQQWVDAYGGSGTGGSNPEAEAAGGGTYYKSYQFAREPKEDSWTAIQRLAAEVGWRAFMVGRALYYMSEEDLYRRAVTYKLTPDDPAVIDVDYDVDWGKTTSELTVQVVLGRWNSPPGSIIDVTGFGPPDGRWLVSAWRRDYFNPVAELTLKQPAREKLEPAPEQASRTATSSDGAGLSSDVGTGTTGLDDSTRVMRAYHRADAIDKKGQGYKWGGGHGSFNDPGGYDCSGFVSTCLNAGGMMSGTGAPMATGGLASWGEPGEGQYMTVWVKETGNPHMSHTFMTFNLKGKVRYAEAGGAESGHTGWHNPRSHAGFRPRHWPGV